jgi:hypothetical protein
MDTEPATSSTDELTGLVQALRDAGDEPTPALLETILAHGAAAIPPLLSFLEEVAAAEPIPRRLDEATAWAAALLSQLGAAEAVPRLLQLSPRCRSVLGDLDNLMVRFGGAARPHLHAYLRGEAGRPDTETREQVVRALGEMGYHPESAQLLIERADRYLNGPRYQQDVAETFGYALLAMRAPEAREILYELEDADPDEWFPEMEEGIDGILARGPAPPGTVPDVVSLLKQRRAWKSLHPDAHASGPLTYEPRPERDPEEQARKRAARQARRAAQAGVKPRAKPSGKSARRR